MSPPPPCGTPSQSIPGCNGSCYIAGCNATYFDVDGVFSNGCEARPDAQDISGVGNFCANDGNSILIANPLNTTPTGEFYSAVNTILPAGDVDWYRIWVDDNGNDGAGYSFQVDLTTNSGTAPGDFVFDLYEDNCSNSVCGNTRSYSFKTNFNYATSGCTSGSPCGNQNCSASGNNHCDMPAQADSWYYVKVYRRAGAPAVGTNTYQLRFRGGYTF
ncbi:MAG: hypothetical protein R3F39_07895 [Myxococcota bacterium]